MKTLVTEMYANDLGAAVLSYATDDNFHCVTLAPYNAAPKVYKLSVKDNARKVFQTLRNELKAEGYAKWMNI